MGSASWLDDRSTCHATSSNQTARQKISEMVEANREQATTGVHQPNQMTDHEMDTFITQTTWLMVVVLG